MSRPVALAPEPILPYASGVAVAGEVLREARDRARALRRSARGPCRRGRSGSRRGGCVWARSGLAPRRSRPPPRWAWRAGGQSPTGSGGRRGANGSPCVPSALRSRGGPAAVGTLVVAVLDECHRGAGQATLAPLAERCEKRRTAWFALVVGRRIIPPRVPPLALLLFVAKVFVEATKVVFHFAKVVLHAPQVAPDPVQALASLGAVGCSLRPSPWVSARHGIKPPLAHRRRARRYPLCSRRGLRVCRGGGTGRT